MTEWCEFCRDHFPGSHYDEADAHKVGKEWGPEGDLPERSASAVAVVDAWFGCGAVLRDQMRRDRANPGASRLAERLDALTRAVGYNLNPAATCDTDAPNRGTIGA
jgi:hypothetical protein